MNESRLSLIRMIAERLKEDEEEHREDVEELEFEDESA